MNAGATDLDLNRRLSDEEFAAHAQAILDNPAFQEMGRVLLAEALATGISPPVPGNPVQDHFVLPRSFTQIKMRLANAITAAANLGATENE